METLAPHKQSVGAIIQRKMRRWEVEAEIRRLEAKFRKADKYDNVSEWYDLQDQLGKMYNRLMEMIEVKHPG